MTSVHTESQTETTTPADGVPTARVASEPTTAAPEQRLGARLLEGTRARFRLHTEDDDAPGNARVLAMTLVAVVCVFVGLVPAGRMMAALAMGHGPWWYPVVTVTLGVVGVGLITAAFAAIHRALLPWCLLAAALMMLVANVATAYLAP